MDNHIKISILCEIYGKLLTEKQCKTIMEYYNDDLSLAEIAENQGISRQAVRDLIKKGEEKLFEYEKTLGIMEKMQKNEKILQQVNNKLNQIAENTSDSKITKILKEIQKELKDIA